MTKTIFALGFFDGVHIGHAALLNRCKELAREYGCKAGVVTFDAHPQSLVKGAAPGLIKHVGDREKLLRHHYFMDEVVILPFDENMRSLPWEDFLTLLRREYGAEGFVCGADFRFGHRGQGNTELLRAYCEAHNLPFGAVSEQFLDGVRISSTYIRRQIATGDMATAVRFLGHPHILTGTVVHGKKLGRRLGIPTANLVLPEMLTLPKFGVYACRAWIEGVPYAAVTNIGTRPTVSGTNVTVEPWILDYSGDLYGREITLEFFRFLRPEEKFPSLEALQQQIRCDAEETRQLLK